VFFVPDFFQDFSIFSKTWSVSGLFPRLCEKKAAFFQAAFFGKSWPNLGKSWPNHIEKWCHVKNLGKNPYSAKV
jgi:hypothetical protein